MKFAMHSSFLPHIIANVPPWLMCQFVADDTFLAYGRLFS